VKSAEEWRWSSYRAAAGLQASPSWLTTKPVLEHFGVDEERAALRFRQFVQAGVQAASPWSALRGQFFLGSEQFVERMRPALARFTASSEIPRADRLAARPALASLFASVAVEDLTKRNAAIVEAHRVHGYTLAEIARHLGLHYSTVSRVAQAADASIQDLTPA
jgi:hypothetical protein